MRLGRYTLFILVVFACHACDKPDCPYADERLCDQAYLDSLGESINENCSDFDTIYKSRVLLEDFTGFRCTNCLPAAITADNLQEEWCDRLVVVAYHVFPEFAAPLSTTPGDTFSIDLRTGLGENLAIDYGIPSLPNGMVNRKQFSGGFIQSAASWPDNVGIEMDEEVIAELYFDDLDYNPISSASSFAMRVVPRSQVETDWNLTIGIYENGIVDGQKDGSSTIFPYTHDHVFRNYINGVYGETALTQSTVLDANGAVSFNYEVTAEEDWVADNCYLFAVLFNSENDEVIGCTKTKFIP